MAGGERHAEASRLGAQLLEGDPGGFELVAGGGVQVTETMSPVSCHACPVVDLAELDVEQEVIAALRQRGARFGFVFGSQARGDQRPDSDVDVAAWWSGDPPASYEVALPSGVDLLVLNKAPLELAGRVAVEGRLLFDDDQVARVRWTAMTRKIYFDELPRLRRAHREFAESVRRGG